MNRQIASTNFTRWQQAVAAGDPKVVAALYAPDLTLLPTMAPNVITNRAGAEEYFIFFGQRNPTVEILEEHVSPAGDKSYVHAGVYRFMLGPQDNREPFDARFSFVWQQNDDGDWQILHHHSSRIPQL